MASEPSTSQAQPQGAEPSASSPEHLVVNLQIVSPSVGVNRPLLFPDLPAATTIKALKAKIRETLPLRPADQNQRLIHQGRALLRETDSLLDVFGADALRTLNRQTIHLVIRDFADSHTSVPSTAVRGSSPVNGSQATAAPRSLPSPLPAVGADAAPGLPRITHFQTSTHHVIQPGMPSTAPAPQHHQHHLQHHQHHPQHLALPQHLPHPHHLPHPQHQLYQHPLQPSPEQALALQHHQQTMANLLGQVQRDAHFQRDAMARVLVSQNQRSRAQMGMRGIGDSAGNNAGTGSEPSTGRASPAISHSVHYETVGPNGQTLQVETIVRPSSQGPLAALSPAEVQNIIRGADANQATMAMANAMQRSVSAASLHNRPLTQPPVTTPISGAGGSSAGGSGRATPDVDSRSTSTAVTHTAQNSSPSHPQQGLQLYILSSPQGPRALLLNAHATETYYSPRLGTQANLPQLGSIASSLNQPFVNQSQHHHTGPQQDQQMQPQDGPAGPAHAQDPPAQPAHPHNPPAGGLPPLLMQLWPHIWLIFRLGLFVWFCTSPNSSWSRWLTIICLAIFMFVLSTGLLNGVAENAWRPIGRHMEHILPALEQPRAGQEAGPGPGQAGGREGGVVPEQMAARLVAERRARGGWLVAQFRRLERAGLLFLASLAPGVAERHIANLEAEARAEDSRRREAEAASAAIASGEGEGDGNAGNAADSEDALQEEQRGRQEHETAQANPGQGAIREEELMAV